MNKKNVSSLFKELWRNRQSRYSLLFAVVGLLCFLALPVGAKYVLRQWLLDNGADTATIGKIRIEPFTGRFYLRDVSVTQNGQTVLSNSTVRVNLGLRALFDREALLEKATLTDAVIDIERYEDGTLRIGSYRTRPEDEQPVSEEDMPWVFRASEVGFSDVLIRYAGDGLRLDLLIEEGTAQRFTTDPQGRAGSLDLEGMLNEAPLTLHLSVLRVNPDLKLEGRLECSGFSLAALAELFGNRLAGLAGRLRAEAGFTMDSGVAGLTATFKGKVGLSEVEVSGQGWTGAGELALDGELGYSSADPSGPRVAIDGLLIARPVSFAMPEKNLRLDRTEATLQGQTSIGLGEAVTVWSDSDFSVGGADFRLDENMVKAGFGTWSGTVDFKFGEGGGSSLTADGGAEFRDLQLAMPGAVELQGKRLTAKGVTSVNAGEILKAGFSGDIALTATGIRAESLTVEGEGFTWQGDAAYAGSNPSSLQLEGALQAERPAVAVPGADLQLTAASLAVDGDAALAFGEGSSYRGASSMTAAGFNIARGGRPLAEVGRFAVDRLVGGNGRLSAEAVVTEAVTLPLSEIMPVAVAFGRASLQSPVTDESLATINFSGLAVDNLSVADDRGTLAQADSLNLNSGTVRDLAAIEAESLGLGSGAFLYGMGGVPQQPLATVVEARGFPFAWSQAQGTQIGQVQADNLVVRYHKSGEPAQAPEDGERQDSGRSEPIPLEIGSVAIGGDSALQYTDPTIDPDFQTTVAVSSLNLSEIDLNSPEAAISYTLEGMVDKYAPLSLRGSIAPLASPFRLEMDGNLQNLSLNSISPYAIDAMGIALQSGQLDLNTDTSVNGDRLDSDNRLQLKNIEIARRHAERARSLEAGLPVPLEMAIDMLSDREGVITVSVPISGRLSEVRVGIQGIVVTALRQAIGRGIVPALAYTALGPGGALAYLGMKIGGALLDSELPALQFAPNRSDLSTGQQALLDKVGPTLQQKMQDGSTYSLCPRVVPGETAGGGGTSALTDEERRRELYRLGEQRGQAVKQYLVQNFNLNPDRLFICNPTLNYGESARGTVEFRK